VRFCGGRFSDKGKTSTATQRKNEKRHQKILVLKMEAASKIGNRIKEQTDGGCTKGPNWGKREIKKGSESIRRGVREGGGREISSKRCYKMGYAK